jgi:hypothetical protein
VNARRVFGIMRMTVGASSWLAPRTTGHSFGLGNVAADDRAALVTRLFGARDLVLGGAVVAATDAEAVRSALALGVAVDVLDVVAVVLGARRGVSKVGALFVGSGAASFAAFGLVLLIRGEQAPIGPA